MNKKISFYLTIIYFLLIGAVTFAQGNNPEWKNPQISGINKIEPRAHFSLLKVRSLPNRMIKHLQNGISRLMAIGNLNGQPIRH